MADYGSGNRVRLRYVGLTTSVAQEVNDATGAVIRSIGNSWTGDHLEDWTGSGSNLRVYGVNGHGDVTWTAGSTGSVTGTARYDPWGAAASVTGSVPDFRFQGSWADGATGLSWAVTRWYAPAQGRFISEDSLLGTPREPDSRHLYAYGAGDPVGRVDPGGTDSFRTFPIANHARLHGKLILSLFINRLYNYAPFDWGPARLYGDNRVFASWSPDCSRSRACITINFDLKAVSVRVHDSCSDWFSPVGWWGYGCNAQFPIVTSPLTQTICGGRSGCVTSPTDMYNLVKVSELTNGRLSILWDITQSRLPIIRPDLTVNGSLAIVPSLVPIGRPSARIYYHGDGFPSEEMYWFGGPVRTDYRSRVVVFQHPEGKYTDMNPGAGDWSYTTVMPQ